MDANRALLDELMGLDRNLVTEEKSKVRGRHFSDENICKLFIQGFCPNDLFTNTKSDLGVCKKLHDEGCKREWTSCDDKSRYSYPADMLKHLERLINEMDIKMERQQAKLNEENTVELSGQAQSKVASLTAECDVLLKKIEDLGEQGLVTEATSAMEVLTRLQAEKEALLKSSQQTLPGMMPVKQMKVCEICGSLLVVGDSIDRVQAHLEGKQHKGYQLIRETIDELKKTMPGRGGDYRNDRNDRDRSRDDRNRSDRDRPRDDRDRRRDDRDIRDNRDYRGRDDRYRDDRRDNRYRNDRGRDNHDRRDYRRDDRDRRDRDDSRHRDRGEDKYRERDEDRSSSKRRSTSPESDRNEKRKHT
jgi:hypothetical protein